jgi:hypothetical protein
MARHYSETDLLYLKSRVVWRALQIDLVKFIPLDRSNFTIRTSNG